MKRHESVAIEWEMNLLPIYTSVYSANSCEAIMHGYKEQSTRQTQL